MSSLGENRMPAVRRCIAEMDEYVPISTPDMLAQRLGLRPDQIIKLDGNENPYGCSPRVAQALGEYDGYHRYPDPMQQEARALLAQYVGAPEESLMFGMGSDELIDYVLRLFLEPGDEVMIFPPTFGMYAFSTQICGGWLVQAPRDDAFDVDLDEAERLLTDRTKLVLLDSPNNPSGRPATREQLERLLATGRVVVVDEAYAEFCTTTFLPLVKDHSNLIVLRTFSKWAGLAGLRVGYGAFPPDVIRQLWKMKQPYNLNLAAEIAVRESLRDSEMLAVNIGKILRERDRLKAQLESLGFLRVYPSQGNFLLCDLLEGNALDLMAFLARRGIILRYFNKPRLLNSIRVSVGLPEHTDAIISAMREWKAGQRPVQGGL